MRRADTSWSGDMGILDGKKGLIIGIANNRSINNAVDKVLRNI